MKGLVTWYHKAMKCWCEDQAGPKMDEYLACAVVTKGGINTKYIVSNVGSATIQGLNSCCGSMRYSASLCSWLAPYWDEKRKQVCGVHISYDTRTCLQYNEKTLDKY